MLTRNRLFYLLKVDILTLVLVEDFLVVLVSIFTRMVIRTVRAVRITCLPPIALRTIFTLNTPFPAEAEDIQYPCNY